MYIDIYYLANDGEGGERGREKRKGRERKRENEHTREHYISYFLL